MIVLDASALVEIVADQRHGVWAAGQMEGHEVIAPAHQPAEVLSAVARLERAGVLTTPAAADALAAIASLPQVLVPPTGAHLRAAFELRERLRVLDGLYVALAAERGVPLVTTDLRLARAAAPCEVIAPPARGLGQ
ncbi:putative nucleic acid-binding protein [Georgenia soli]|uniref:Ribonuclease VapC n=1 Tax=Georgenia soli TaxID=638953 RepID=A0A2A9EL81_9MICO|nr:type II toxin-antitoxin system VapC family toxin [Georgenia soli]PFG39000.1 putative nucleic acid-binding protein [Georgenia soli]